MNKVLTAIIHAEAKASHLNFYLGAYCAKNDLTASALADALDVPKKDRTVAGKKAYLSYQKCKNIDKRHSKMWANGMSFIPTDIPALDTSVADVVKWSKSQLICADGSELTLKEFYEGLSPAGTATKTAEVVAKSKKKASTKGETSKGKADATDTVIEQSNDLQKQVAKTINEVNFDFKAYGEKMLAEVGLSGKNAKLALQALTATMQAYEAHLQSEVTAH